MGDEACEGREVDEERGEDMNRSAESLRRDQAEILSSYRGERMRQGEVAVLPRPGGSTAAVAYGRVSAVMTSDPTYGPHLLVIRQVWSGVPPTASDVDGEAMRCYPTPNRAAGAYTVGDYVRIAATRGAMVAETLA